MPLPGECWFNVYQNNQRKPLSLRPIWHRHRSSYNARLAEARNPVLYRIHVIPKEQPRVQ